MLGDRDLYVSVFVVFLYAYTFVHSSGLKLARVPYQSYHSTELGSIIKYLVSDKLTETTPPVLERLGIDDKKSAATSLLATSPESYSDVGIIRH